MNTTRWMCPACGREFARSNQGHTCVPGGSVDDTFRPYPPGHRAIFDEVMAAVAGLGPVHVDAVDVGVFLKRTHKLAEVRPVARSVRLLLALPGAIDHPLVVTRYRPGGGRTWHNIKLTAPEDVDEDVRGWIALAYALAE